ESIPDALYWDLSEPYYYFRKVRHDEKDLLLVGGADHKTGETPDQPFFPLSTWTASRFQVLSTPFQWSSQYYPTDDGLPYMGPLPGSPHVWFATGFDGTGLTWGTVAAEMWLQAILGKEP